MKKNNMKNIGRLLKFNLMNYRRTIYGWTIALTAITFMYMILFSSMQEMATVKLEMMPDELLKFMGMEDISAIGNYVSYFGMIFNLLLIALSIFASTFSCKIIVSEEKNKSMEYLYSLPTSRSEIYLAKVLTSFIATTFVLLGISVSTIVCGFLNGGDTFVLMDILTIIKLSGFIGYLFAAIGIFLAALKGLTSMITSSAMITIFVYFIGYLARLLQDKASWLKYFSPFEILAPTNVLNLSNNGLITLFVYFILFICLYVLGLTIYQRRDFNL